VKLVRVLRKWGQPVIWIHAEDPPAKLTVTAEAPPVPVVNNYYLLPPGTDVRGLIAALPPGTAAATEEE
jgi:hypothetical protein